jgi:tight adherence protein C
VTLIVLLGALAGCGLAMILGALLPARPTLSEALAQLEFRPGPPRPRARNLDERVGRLVGRSRGGGPHLNPGLRADLALLEIEPAAFLGSRIICGLACALLAPALAAVAVVAGDHAGWQVPGAGSLLLGLGGYLLPLSDVGRRARQRRRQFVRTLSSFLDVLAIALAAGEMISGALTLASRSGDGWAYVLIRRTLRDADQRGVAPWDALARAATELGLSELGEVAASVRLAGADGAQVRRTLMAKAEGLRVRTLTDLHRQANEATSRMVLPLVGFVVGFLTLMAYPALTQILGA